MGRWQISRRSPIGLDLGSHSIKAVQLRLRGERWQMEAVASFARTVAGGPIVTAEIVRLRGVLERAGFVGRSVVLAVPAADLLSGMMELPPRTAGVPFDQIARMEFARVHKCEPHGMELSFWDLPVAARASKGTQVMAVGYAHSAADKYLDMVEAAGLDVAAMDAPMSALARSCAVFSSAGTTAILDLGYDRACLGLMQDGILTYERLIPDASLKRLTTALKEQLDLNDEEIHYLMTDGGFGEPGERRGAEQFAVARGVMTMHFTSLLADLQMTFSYTEQQYPQSPVKSLLLCGGGAGIRGLEHHMRAALGVETKRADPCDAMDCSRVAKEQVSPVVMAAVGLAQFS